MSLGYIKSMLSVVVVSLLPVMSYADPVAAPQPSSAPPASSTPAPTGTPPSSDTPATPASDTPATPASDTSAPPASDTSAPATSAPASTTTQPASGAATSGDSFHQVCVKSWMGRNADVKDKTDFQNFGEKYCTCAETQTPLDTNEAINMAAQVCMSRTLLQDTADNLSDEVGLGEVKDSDFDEYCMDRWELVYPGMDDNDKKAATGYCDCAKPKLLELFKKSSEMTDQAYSKAIDDVAATCSGKVGK